MPSSLVLNAYRLIVGRPFADYSELTTYLGEPAGFRPQDSSPALNGWEWWLSLHHDGGYAQDSVLDCYPELAQGMFAGEERTTETMTLYDGRVPSAKGVLNPFEKQKMFSASQLENLATCPFRFFMTYLLHIEPLEDLEKDPNQWLQGAPRGTLLHDVFRRFMEHLIELGERPNQKTHWGYLKDLAMESIEKWKEVIPPPSAFSYDREVREILQTCETFLRDEEERCRTIEPCFFELSFGVKNEDGQPAYEAVEIPIRGKDSFLLRGRIDRVDRRGDHIYEVWDYKTGSSYGYKESDYYKKGRQIQHVLYSMAAENLLRQHYDSEASVVRGGYYFPGPKGEGLRIERDETKRGEALRILDQLFSLLTTGVFPSAYDTDACSFCLCSPACGGGAKAVSRCQDLLAGSETLLEPLRRLLDND
jgi:ATP-dependent helicase/nuclease subunit B